MSAEVIAYHGWGFDASCWQSWQQQVTQQGICFQASDRGYFGTPLETRFINAPTKIILAHSYGLHLCPIAQLQQANLLVLFGGFAQFHPRAMPLRRRSQLVVQAMLRQLQEKSELVLNRFKTQCYAPQADELNQNAIEDLNLLIQDLEQLNHCMIDLHTLRQIPQVIMVHGSSDRIVSPRQGKHLSEQLQNSRYIEIPDAGHAVPFTHFEICWSVATHDSYFS